MCNNKKTHVMKTLKIFSINPKSIFALICMGGFVSSCGSYSNLSYYDNDGVYQSNQRVAVENSDKKVSQTGSYFTQFQDYDVVEEEPVGIFTDVDGYYGNGNSYSESNPGWGNSTSSVTVNYYGGYGYYPYYSSWGNPYWGYNYWYGPSWGWSIGWNSWYGGYWGWNYGWGGYYYPYYGGYYHHHHYYNTAYVSGPRYGSDYGYRNRAYATRGNSRSVSTRQPRAYEVRTDRATRSDSRFTTSQTRSSSNVNTTRSSSQTRNSTINSNNTTRGTSNGTRNSTINTTRSTRVDTPSIGRGSSNSGGSRSSGSSGGSGGRSSSGGGRR